MQGQSTTEAPSEWPTVVGTIAIVYGALGGLIAAGGFVLEPLLAGTANAGVPDGFQPPAEVTAISLIDGLLGIVFATMLVWGGVLLAKRRKAGAGLLRAYAIARLSIVIPLAVGQAWAGNLTATAVLAEIERQAEEERQ